MAAHSTFRARAAECGGVRWCAVVCGGPIGLGDGQTGNVASFAAWVPSGKDFFDRRLAKSVKFPGGLFLHKVRSN